MIQSNIERIAEIKLPMQGKQPTIEEYCKYKKYMTETISEKLTLNKIMNINLFHNYEQGLLKPLQKMIINFYNTLTD